MEGTMREFVSFAMLLVLALALPLLCVSVPQSWAQNQEATLDEINKFPESERQARLVNGARKEGTVTWYVAMNRAYAQDLINAFEAQYPFIKVNALTGGGGGLLNRVLAEHRAKSFQYDVFNTRSMTINTLKKAGAIMRYRSPYRHSLRDGFYDTEGYLNGIFATPLVFIFNTKLVNRKEAPASLEDLLNPKWSGKMAMDDESFDWLAAVLDYYGEAKGTELAGKLGEQKLNVRRGPTLLRGILCGDRRPSPGGYCQEEGWRSHRLQLSPTLRSGEVIDSDLPVVPPASSVCCRSDGGFSYVQKGPGDHVCTRPLGRSQGDYSEGAR